MNFLKQTLKGTKKYILLTFVLSAVYSKLLVYVPMFIQYALDGIILGNTSVIPYFIRNLFYSENKISQILVLVVVLICLNIIIFLVNYIKLKTNTLFNLKINRNVKLSILEHIPKLEYLEFSKIDKSNVMQRVNNDAAIYSDFFNSQITLFFDTIFVVIFAVAQTIELNISVGIFIIIICSIIVILSILFFKISNPIVEDIVELNRDIINRTTMSVEESKMLKIFNRQEKEINEFSKINKKCKAKEITFAKLRAIYVITVHTLRNFKEPFILLWGGILVVKGELTLATISILLSYATKILSYAYESSEKLSKINEFIVAYKKLSNLMEYKEDKEINPDIELDGDIVFKDVSIKIDKNEILKNLNFDIKLGENVAIIGDNGSGKTIIAKTLIGFYDYTGEIFIGKNNIKNVSKNSIRSYIGIVLQDTYLFTDTIKNNINITSKIVSDSEIIEVCRLADIYEDIKKFEGNIQYVIGNGGNNISGGQKQRIAIARTLLRDNKFIVFDDSLSKLDTKTKLNILNNIISIKRGSIILSHDVEVVKKCDKVLFINNKTVIVGKHEELMERQSTYKDIIEMTQNKIFAEEEI